MMMDVTTTSGERFTRVQHVDLARLVYLRFGRDEQAATEAWRRLLQNSCEVEAFMKLVYDEEHTPNCDGWCCCAVGYRD